MLETALDLRLLRAQPIGGEHEVGVRDAVRAQSVHERRELGIACRAGRAVTQMLGHPRIGRFARTRCQEVIEQSLVDEMRVAHGLPPSSPRSLRAARNK